MLNPVEWDFRALPEEELSDCIWWEYLRQSPKNRHDVEAWLDSVIEGKSAREWLSSPCPTKPKEKQKWGRCGLVAISMGESFSTEIQNLIEDNPGFPKPWQSLKREPKHFGSTIRVTSLQTQIQRWSERAKRNPKLGLEWLATVTNEDRFVFDVNFLEARNIEAIKADFAKWITQEAARRNFSRAKGRSAATPWHLLKNLSALRLEPFFFGFTEAKDFLLSHQKKHPLSEENETLPIFAQQNNWDRAIKAARELIKKQEARKKQAD